jgi:hypothetical protein
MNSQDAETLDRYIDDGFRRLHLADIEQANECGVRLGTFALCAAFIDSLALAYGHESGATGDEGKWNVFVGRFFAPETRTALRGRYEGFRCILLHDFSASGFAFAHGRSELHLKVKDGLTVVNREDFVVEVEAAFERFRTEVSANDELRERVLEWLTLDPPIGPWLVADADLPTSLADSFTAARMRPATTLSSVGNGLQFLVADTLQLDTAQLETARLDDAAHSSNGAQASNATAPSAKKTKQKKQKKNKQKKKQSRD